MDLPGAILLLRLVWVVGLLSQLAGLAPLDCVKSVDLDFDSLCQLLSLFLVKDRALLLGYHFVGSIIMKLFLDCVDNVYRF